MLRGAAKFIFFVIIFSVIFVSGQASAWETSSSLLRVSTSGTPSSALTSGSPTIGDFIPTGAFTYTVSVSTPAGRLGLAPKINLNYSSQSGSGWAGVGWNLDFGYIQRNTAFGLSYTGYDFIFVKDGATLQLVRVGATNEYRAKIDDGSLLRFFYQSDDSWKVYDKSGMVYSFGSSAASRQDNPSSASQVFKWMVDTVIDTHGNYMTFEYLKDQGQGEIYPQRIWYTYYSGSGSSAAPAYRVDFTLEPRPDSYAVYVANFAVTQRYRLKGIGVYQGSSLVSYHELKYATSARTGRSLLTKVQQFGSDTTFDGQGNAIGSSMPAHSFTWTQSALNYTATGNNPQVSVDSGNSYNAANDLRRIIHADFNGDGKTDVAVVPSGAGNIQIYLANGTGGYTEIQGPYLSGDPSCGEQYCHDAEVHSARVLVGAFAGQGKSDIMILPARFSNELIKIYRLNITSNVFAEVPNAGAGISFSIRGYECANQFNEKNCSDSGVFDVARIMLGDFNGDGNTDILILPTFTNEPINGAIQGNMKIYLANAGGTGFIKKTGPLMDVNGCYIFQSWTCYFADCFRCRSWSNIDYRRIILGDFNGDGKTDIGYIAHGGAHGSSGYQPLLIYLGTADGVSLVSNSGPSLYVGGGRGGKSDEDMLPALYDLSRVFLADFNGDGKTDIAQVFNNDFRIFLSRGTDFIQAANGPNIGINSSNPLMSLARIKLADYNGDGKTDIAYKSGGETALLIYASKGDGFQEALSGPVLTLSTANDETKWIDASRIRTGDFIGDGKADISYLSGDPAKNKLYSDTAMTDLMATASNGRGSTFTMTYQSSNAMPYAHIQLPYSVPVLVSLNISDTKSQTSSTSSYLYGDGYYDTQLREFRGFGYVKKTNPDSTTIETWFHKRDDSDWSEFADYKGKPIQIQIKDPSGTLLEQTDFTYVTENPGGYPKLAALGTKVTTRYIGDGIVTSSETNVYNSSTYNLISQTVSGQDPDYTPAESVTTSYEYVTFPYAGAPSGSGAVFYRASRTTVTGSSSGKVRETYFRYFDNGDLKEKEFWLDQKSAGESNPVVSMTYTPEGNVSTVKDALANVTTTTYDTDTRTYPASVTNALGHTVSATYDPRYGKVLTQTDANMNITSFEYDSFGRLKRKISPDTGTAESGDVISVYTDTDGLGRPLQKSSMGEGNKTVITRTYYDNMGRPYLATGPFYGTGNSYPQAEPAVYPWQQTKYDYFGNPVEIESPSIEATGGKATVTVSYKGLSKTVTDPDFKGRAERRDYLGRLIEVTEFGEANAQYKTAYIYNAAGNLTQVKDYLDRTTTISYDSLGRKLSMTDTNMGQWQYSYDANGNLKTQTDAKGQITTFIYDALNRVTDKLYSTNNALIETNVKYIYDTLPERNVLNGTGKLVSVSNGRVTTTYDSYDAGGRAVSQTEKIESAPGSYNTYTTLMQYDRLGRLLTMTYPDLYTVTYGYHAGTSLLSTVKGSDGVTYASHSLYEPSGKIGQIDYGNNTSVRYTYNSFTTRLMGIIAATPQSSGSATDIINRSYTYSAAGNILRIVDNKSGAQYAYQYDSLHRLLGETPANSSLLPQSYTYKPDGNIDTKTAEGNLLQYQYDPQHIHAVSSITGSGVNRRFEYDANGNMLLEKDGNDSVVRSFIYNTDNKPVQITISSLTTTLLYDADGGRARKTSPSGTTYYVGRHYEINPAGEQIKYIFAGDMRVARVKSVSATQTETHYYHGDHLGSAAAMTDATGAIVETTGYQPFGAMRQQTGQSVSNFKYTDQELDPETGLYYYGARYYDPTTGRFISADTIVSSPRNPQSLNRYSYVLNNPLIYTDPTGHSSFWKSFWGGYYTGLGIVFTAMGIPGSPVVLGEGMKRLGVNVTYFSSPLVGMFGTTGGGLGAMPNEAINGNITIKEPTGEGGTGGRQMLMIELSPCLEAFIPPTSRGVRGEDAKGCGYFGCSRGDGPHQGFDNISVMGDQVPPPQDGIVRLFSSGKYEGVQIIGLTFTIEYLYVKPDQKVIAAGASGLPVKQGIGTIGTAKDITGTDFYGPKMTNHIHVQMRLNGGLYLNPTPFFYRPANMCDTTKFFIRRW